MLLGNGHAFKGTKRPVVLVQCFISKLALTGSVRTVCVCMLSEYQGVEHEVFVETRGRFLSKLLTIGFGPKYSADLVQDCEDKAISV